ncbi:hypothetical protein NMY22_g3261 [Coprinellus aureogranulatus]|nr:hypothetical protein NMY22_g3261 [Coprinellus aureogranulatus]
MQFDKARRAIEFVPTDHSSLSNLHDNLGQFYLYRFSSTSDITALSNAIQSQRKALSLSSPTHYGFTTILASLGMSVRTRYYTTRSDISDLQEAISLTQRSLDFTPKGHANIADRQSFLADSYFSLYHALGVTSDLDKAFALYSLATQPSTTPPRWRLSYAKSWVARSIDVQSATQLFSAVEVMVGLIPTVVGLETTLEKRYEQVSELSLSILAAALYAVVRAERPDKSLEWLEHGRGLVWRQLSGLRSPLDDLRKTSPELADHLRKLSEDLERASIVPSRKPFGPGFSGTELDANISLHAETAKQVRISTEREKILETIRTTAPGFENFLQPSSVDQLLEYLPEHGPVVILGSHPVGCYALALLAGRIEPLHIPLPFSWTRAQELGAILKASLAQYGVRSCDYGDEHDLSNIMDSTSDAGNTTPRSIRRYPHTISNINRGVSLVLRELWLDVVKPVLEALALLSVSSSEDAIRVWWCPTGPFTSLPIHAAGIYSGDQRDCLGDHAVSSYTPTVSILTERVKEARIRATRKTRDTAGPGLLVVSQADAPRLASIPGVTIEADRVSQLVQESGV